VLYVIAPAAVAEMEEEEGWFDFGRGEGMEEVFWSLRGGVLELV